MIMSQQMTLIKWVNPVQTEGCFWSPPSRKKWITSKLLTLWPPSHRDVYVRLRSAEVPSGYPTKKGIAVIKKLKSSRGRRSGRFHFSFCPYPLYDTKRASVEEREVYVKIDVTTATEVWQMFFKICFFPEQKTCLLSILLWNFTTSEFWIACRPRALYVCLRSQPSVPRCVVYMWSWCLKEYFALTSAVKGPLKKALTVQRPTAIPSWRAGLDKGETVVQGCQCLGGMVVCLR